MRKLRVVSEAVFVRIFLESDMDTSGLESADNGRLGLGTDLGVE